MACATDEGRSGADMGDDLEEWWEGKESRWEGLRRCIRGSARESCKGKRRTVTGEGNESQPRAHEKETYPYYITLQ